MSTKFSLVAPSIRPHLWETFCKPLSKTKIDWEVIFVGPEGLDVLPPNVRWIKTNVKPSQCTHIGFLEAKGEIISLTADDAEYFSPNGESAIDNMYNFMQNFDRQDIAFGFRMFEDKFCVETSTTHYLTQRSTNFTQPLLYPFFAIRKEIYLKLGGYDIGFVCGQAENDFLLRVAFEIGSTISSLCPTAMVWADHEKHTNSGSFRKYHSKENTYLKSLWMTSNGMPSITRLSSLRPYTDKDLYTISQGETGEW